MNLNRLINTLSIQTASYDSDRMSRYIMRQLDNRNIPYTQDKTGNIYATKGNAKLYPTMVSHIDTVHAVNEDVVVKRQGNNLYAIDTYKMEQYGIGGDDKVGVFITLELLDIFQHFKAVFFVDEEVGCIGSSHCNHKFFEDSTIVLQCDRKGAKDFTSTILNQPMLSVEFMEYVKPIVKSFNREYVNGGMTDVHELSEHIPICMANMSCGYYNPHSAREYVNIENVFDTLEFCKQILTSTAHKQWSIKRPVYPSFTSYAPSANSIFTKSKYSYSYSEPLYDYYDDFIEDTSKQCELCNENLLYDHYDNSHYCIECDISFDNNYKKQSHDTNTI